MALVTIDDELDSVIEKFVDDNRVNFPNKAFYLNQLIIADLKKRGMKWEK